LCNPNQCYEQAGWIKAGACSGAYRGAATIVQDEKLIEASEGPVFAVSRADGLSDIVLVCEHAANRMPRALGTLGLDRCERSRATSPGTSVLQPWPNGCRTCSMRRW
jgi:hypothetical protein